VLLDLAPAFTLRDGSLQAPGSALQVGFRYAHPATPTEKVIQIGGNLLEVVIVLDVRTLFVLKLINTGRCGSTCKPSGPRFDTIGSVPMLFTVPRRLMARGVCKSG
jgi:hypothetical protein